ncbi:hypothetical protein TB2_012489 [Malus domestica]|nr:uncharacterized protein LOC108175097 isoform X3 [Malus domestica]
MGGHAALSATTFDPGVCEPFLQPKQVGQGHGEKSTLEMGTKGNKLAELLWHLLFWFFFDKLTCSLFAVRCTDMGKSRQGKAGIVLWMRGPITSKSLDLVLVLSAYRLSRITGGQMSLVTLANCCQLNLEKGHLASTLPLILDHCRLQLMNHQMNFLQYRAAQRILSIFDFESFRKLLSSPKSLFWYVDSC